MSRVTNSILLRFGITEFWSSSLLKKKNASLFLTVNFLLLLVLKNYFLQMIKSHYCKNNITIYVFKLKKDKFSFVEKYLFFKNVKKNALYYRKHYSFLSYINKEKNISIIKKLNYISKLALFSSLILNLYLLNSSYLSFPNVLNNKYFFRKKKVNKILFTQLFITKKINYYLKLKLLGFFISNLIFNYIVKDIFVSIKSVTECLSGLKFPFFFKKIKSSIEKKHSFFRILLSFSFFNAKILSFDINKLLVHLKNKKHINTLSSYLNLVKIIFMSSILPLSGLKIQVAGRLNGKLRKSRFGYFFGSIKQMTFNNNCNFVFEPIYTQYGVFSLKIWYFR